MSQQAQEFVAWVGGRSTIERVEAAQNAALVHMRDGMTFKLRPHEIEFMARMGFPNAQGQLDAIMAAAGMDGAAGEPPRYVIQGGHIMSRNDGQWHHISADQVARLHHLAPGEWVRFNPRAKYPPDAIYLSPRTDGEYQDLSARP